MFKRLFQRSPASFFSKGWKVSTSVVTVSTMLLFLLFFRGNDHTLAKTLNFVQPALQTTSTNNVSTQSKGLVSSQVSARPTIRLKPTSGFVGTSTTIVGDHFASRETISVSSGNWSVAKARTDTKGHFVLSFRIPLLAPHGFNLVKAVSTNRKQSATASFIAIVPRPSASLSPNHGLPGKRITIVGKNFTRKGHIIILLIDPRSSISSVGITLGHINASATGTISTHFTIPRGLKIRHSYTIQVLDIQGAHSLSFSFMTR